MENIDIIILTSILATLFVVFGIVVYKEFKSLPEQSQSVAIERGPRANMIRFIGSLFDEGDIKTMNPVIKTAMYGAIKRTISDMESDGVYFPEEIKEKLETKRKEMICEYTGLSSMLSYLASEDEFNQGHS